MFVYAILVRHILTGILIFSEIYFLRRVFSTQHTVAEQGVPSVRATESLFKQSPVLNESIVYILIS